MNKKRPLFSITFSLIALLVSATATAETSIKLTPLRANLIDAAELYHQQQDKLRRENPSKLARIQYYQLQETSLLPKALSKQLTLQSISHDAQQVFHYYYLPNYQSQEKLNPSITHLTRMLALKNLCKEGSNSKDLLQGKIEFVLFINDKQDQQLLQETMRLSDCENI